MTTEQVPLAEQIAFVERDARKLAAYYATGGHAAHYFEHDLACVRAVLATLQQHELLRELYSATTQAWLEAGERITALRQQHERAMAALRRTLTFLTEKPWGMIDYMEGSRIYADIEDAAADIRAAMMDDAASEAATPAGKGEPG